MKKRKSRRYKRTYEDKQDIKNNFPTKKKIILIFKEMNARIIIWPKNRMLQNFMQLFMKKLLFER